MKEKKKNQMIFGYKLNADKKYSKLLKKIIEISFLIIVLLALVLQIISVNLISNNMYYLMLTLAWLFIYILAKYIYINKFYFFPTIYFYVLAIFTFLANILGEIYNFYEVFPWWDNALHLVSGVLIGFVVIVIFDYYHTKLYIRKNLYKDALFTIVIASAASLSIAVVWELFEFSFDMYFNTNMQDGIMIDQLTSINDLSPYILKSGRFMDKALIDTMFDQFLAVCGATLSAIINYFIFERNRTNNFYQNHIELENLSKEELIDVIHNLNYK